MKSMSMSGKYVVVGLVGFTFVFAMAFWWFQEHAFYEETVADTAEVMIDDVAYPVTNWRGITSTSSPLKMRACFVLRTTIDVPPSTAPTPLVAPGWFKCFNAQYITESLASEYGKAYVAERNDPPGFDRIVATFPGGNTYMWRQLSEQVSQ